MAINYSDSLRRRLQEIAPKSPIAVALLYDEYTSDKHGNYITMRPNGMASFQPRGRAQEYITQRNGVERWAKEGRQEIRPGRLFRQVIRREYRSEFTDAQWDQFIALLTYTAIEGEIGLVHGTDISYWYDGKHYAPNSGSLNSSCMKHDPARTKFYAINPDTIAMLALIDGKKLKARAIVWQTDIGPFMDRVYGNPNSRAAFIAHAEREGWWHYGDVGYIRHPEHRDNRESKPMRVPIQNFDVDIMPYRDTMVYEYRELGLVANTTRVEHQYPTALATWTKDKPVEVDSNHPLLDQSTIQYNMDMNDADDYHPFDDDDF